MKPRSILSALYFLALVAYPPLAAAQALPIAEPASLGLSAQRLNNISKVFEAHVKQGKLPGVVFMIARDGRLAYSDALGFRDPVQRKAMKQDAIFRIYSMSKVITGAASLIAFERGLFLLHDPISIHLPALAKPRVLRFDGDDGLRAVDARREITVLDLLRHTSGLSYSFLAPPPYGDRYVAAGITPGLRGLPEKQRNLLVVSQRFQSQRQVMTGGERSIPRQNGPYLRKLEYLKALFVHAYPLFGTSQL